MNIAGRVAHDLTERGNSVLQRLDVKESATWFLLFFIYAHGFTTDEIDISRRGILPIVTLPQASLVMSLFCLVAAVVVFIERVVPSNLRILIARAGCSWQGRCFHRVSVLFAFILGVSSGFEFLDEENVSIFSWLEHTVDWLAAVILIVMVIQTVLQSRTRTEVDPEIRTGG